MEGIGHMVALWSENIGLEIGENKDLNPEEKKASLAIKANLDFSRK